MFTKANTKNTFFYSVSEASGNCCKIGNAYLKWAFSEAVCLMLRDYPEAKSFAAKKEKTAGKGKAMSILAARLSHAIYVMLKRKEPFDRKKFFRQ